MIGVISTSVDLHVSLVPSRARLRTHETRSVGGQQDEVPHAYFWVSHDTAQGGPLARSRGVSWQ
jgi:hypothetical protein